METSQQPAEGPVNNPKGLLPVIILPTDTAWVVVFVALYQNFLLEGLPLTIFSLASDLTPGSSVTIQDKYRDAAWFFGFSSIFTPISCSLLNWYSFKVISMIGASVICLAMILTYFAQDYPSITFIFLCIIGGFGSSMINATAICLPNVWFCHRRDMACIISSFGQSLGIIFIPWFTKRIFIEDYDFTVAETYLLYAGLCIPLVALGLAVPKVHGISIQVERTKNITSKVTFRDQEHAENLAKSMSILGVNNRCYAIFKTFHNLVFPRVKDMIKERSVYILIPREENTKCVNPPHKKRSPIYNTKPVSHNNSEVSFNFYGVQDVHLYISPKHPGYGCRPFYRTDIFFSACITGQSVYYRQTNQLDYHMAISRAISMKDYQQEIGEECIIFPEAFTRTFLSMLHLSIWKQFHFAVLQLALVLCYFGHYIPFIFINGRSLEFGNEEMYFTIMNHIGVAHLAGRLLALIFQFFCCLPDGIFTLLFFLFIEGCFSIVSNYFPELGFQITYGWITGLYMSISELVMVPAICKITGMSNLTNAMGFVFIFQGLGIVAGTVMCVAVINRWDTVTCAYHISGSCLIGSALCLMPLKKLKQLSREQATDIV